MLKKRRLRQLYIALACLAVAFSFLPQSARAASRIDTERPVSLTLCYQREQAVPGVEFSLYRVAEVSGSAAFRLTGDFAGYRVSLDQPSSAAWRALAETLASYAARDNLKPLDSGRTGSDGSLRFPNQQTTLLPGLYLVVGERHTSGNYTYTPSPFLICLPNLNEATDQWVYDETVDPKYTGDKDDDRDDTVSRKVLKVWEDDGNEEERPKTITVQLLRNGRVWDTVTLSEKNNWRYLWTGLDADDTWRVVEETVPEGYTVSISREGITFVVTNTYRPDVPDTPEPPDQPDKPTPPDTPNQPDRPDRPGTPGTTTPGKPTIPQTGALWWPVPVLAAGGMLLFLLGWARSQRRRREDER
ncbi:MAG: Cna B-type domain-containing protein [Dysosmobacter sp.]|nr:Cna B-type domain-containing protein [Dysosmobacter sp.]